MRHREIAALAVCLTLAMSGCCWGPKFSQKHPRSIDELYNEAVAARAKYPEYSRMQGQPSIPTEVPIDGTPMVEFSGGELASQNRNGATQAIPNQSVLANASSTQSAKRDSRIILASATQTESTPHGPRVSEIFEETEIRQAIQTLATQASVSVVVDDRIGGVTSAHIDNEPFESALRKILLPLGFVCKKKGEHYLVGVIDPQSAMFSQLAETVEFRPLHLAPQELLQLLPESLKKYVQVIEKRNVMIVEAPDEVAQRIVSRLQASDRPVPQVVLEAMVCVINPTKSFQFNVDAKQSLTIDGKDLLNVGLTGLAFTGNGTPNGVNGAFSDFALTSTFLRLLAQEGYVTIRAAPRVMAKDGEKATISINRETFFSIQPNNANIFFQSNLQQIDAGITLDIVPVVRGDTVTVNIEKAEVSEPIRQQDRNDIADSRFPLINRRKVATTVHVQDGQTIVIGGLVQRQTVDRVSRIPGIGDIPWFGRLFQYIDQEDAEAEVVIFIAPRIVQPTSIPSMPTTTPGSIAFPRPVEISPHLNSPQLIETAPSPMPIMPAPAATQPEQTVRPAPSKSANPTTPTLPPSNTATRSETPNSQPSQSSTKTTPDWTTASPTSPRVTQPSKTPASATPPSPNSATPAPDVGHTAPKELRFLAPIVTPRTSE